MVADLILATSQVPDVIRFLADEGGHVRGFDAVLVSTGAPPFVPHGKSFWEFGCDRKLAEKAKKEVASRTRAVAPSERAEATLVFVTPWHYDNPRKPLPDFVSDLAIGKGWSEIRVLDGAQLKHWLAQAPGVAARWARTEMGCFPQGVRSTDEFWEEYSTRFDPVLREEVILAGREAQVALVLDRLTTLQPDRIAVSADSPDEALAFAVAALRKADPAVQLVLKARSIVVDSLQAARDLREKQLIFFPTVAASGNAGLLAQWGPTVVSLGRRHTRGGEIQLRRPARHEFAQALEGGRIGRTRAMQLAAECGRSVTVLARRCPAAGTTAPAWASQASRLLPALLAGAWDSGNEADRTVLMALAGAANYDDWQATVQPFLQDDDPPLEHEGTAWKVRAPVDAFVVLGAHIGLGHFNRLRNACLDVFSDLDANIGKPSSERLMAGPGLRHSTWLREGLATSLLLTATFSESAGLQPALASRGGSERWVAGVVSALPGLTSDTRLLVSLRDELPLLAEAAPIHFVSAIEVLIRTEPTATRALFIERVEFISPESDHVSLLWALETLAWDADLLPRVCVVLTRLATLDPGGKLSNRPMASLRAILLPWLPSTDAALQARLGAFKAVVRTDERVGWELSLLLLPEHLGVAGPTHRPRIREAGAHDRGVTRNEAAALYRAASAKCLCLVGSNPDRWMALIKHFPMLADEDRTAATERLDALLAAVPTQTREALWATLRTLVLQHSGLPEADWTLKGESLAALVRIVERWIPSDPVKAAALLLDEPRNERVSTIDGIVGTVEDLERRSGAALLRVLHEEGQKGLLRLIEATRSSWTVGRKIAELVQSPSEALEWCKVALAADGPKATNFAIALSAGRARLGGDRWTALIKSAHEAGQPNRHTAILLLGLDDGPATWDLARSLGPSVDNAYWTTKEPWRFGNSDGAMLERAASEFLRVGRASAALIMLDEAGQFDPGLAFHALDRTLAELASGAAADYSMLAYHAERVFDVLRARAEVDRVDLARREYAWLPLLAGPGQPRRNLALFELIATNPADFVAFLRIVFRAASASPPVEGEVDDAQCRAAYNVLEAFRRVPGVTPEGVDGNAMGHWVREVLELAAQADLADVGARYVGRLLAHTPPDEADNAWPTMPLRDLIEELSLDYLETSILIERVAMRGAYCKGIYDGGSEERCFAQRTRVWVDACRAWPRTAAMLGRLADEWDRQAEREDVEARQQLMRD